MRRSVVAAVVAATALAGLVLLGAGCGGGEKDIEGVPVEEMRNAATALCTAQDQARRDVMAARTTFYDRSHDVLHSLARALDDEDRALAARLLEDKGQVETDLNADPVRPSLAADLGRLAESARAGLAALSVTVPPCG